MQLIQIESVSKAYANEEGDSTVALDAVSLAVSKGEFVAIMGPSGSGKSTLLHILGFLDRYTSGKYFFDEREVNRYSEEEMAHVRNRKMGFIFQSFNLLPRTSVLENVKLPLLYSAVPETEWAARAARAIESVGLTNRSGHHPGQLSGGERQRAAIARALVMEPEVIFADEPTGNLDSKSGQMVMQTLQELNTIHGHTIVLITHETETAEHAERIIRLKDGRIESDQKVRTRLSAHSFRK